MLLINSARHHHHDLPFFKYMNIYVREENASSQCTPIQSHPGTAVAEDSNTQCSQSQRSVCVNAP